jgi:hypothetical protein
MVGCSPGPAFWAPDQSAKLESGVAMLGRYGPASAIPALLAFAGPAVLVGVTHGGFLPFALGWWGVAFIIGLVSNRRARIVATVALIPVCVLTVFEGGLFMLPAALALLLIDLRARSGTAGHGPAHPSRP